ncbi:MAG: hypothetical protein ACYDBJ_00730 [Aggregatilineales bacterium]
MRWIVLLVITVVAILLVGVSPRLGEAQDGATPTAAATSATCASSPVFVATVPSGVVPTPAATLSGGGAGAIFGANACESFVESLAARLVMLQSAIGGDLQESLTDPGGIKVSSSDGLLTVYGTNEFFVSNPDEANGKLLFDQPTVDRLANVMIIGWVWQMEGSTHTSMQTIINNRQQYTEKLKQNKKLAFPAHLLPDYTKTQEMVSKLLQGSGITLVRLGTNIREGAAWATTVQKRGDFGAGTLTDNKGSAYFIEHRSGTDSLTQALLEFSDIINEFKVITPLVNTRSTELELYLFPQLATIK